MLFKSLVFFLFFFKQNGFFSFSFFVYICQKIVFFGFFFSKFHLKVLKVLKFGPLCGFRFFLLSLVEADV